MKEEIFLYSRFTRKFMIFFLKQHFIIAIISFAVFREIILLLEEFEIGT